MFMALKLPYATRQGTPRDCSKKRCGYRSNVSAPVLSMAQKAEQDYVLNSHRQEIEMLIAQLESCLLTNNK